MTMMMTMIKLKTRKKAGGFISHETANNLIENYLNQVDPPNNYSLFSIESFLKYDEEQKCTGYTVFFGEYDKNNEQTFVIIPTKVSNRQVEFLESAYNMGSLGVPPKKTIVTTTTLVQSQNGANIAFSEATEIINRHHATAESTSNCNYFTRRNLITYLKRLQKIGYDTFAIFSGAYKNQTETIIFAPQSTLPNHRVPAFNMGSIIRPPKLSFDVAKEP
jgi:hypothetical protein